MIERARAAARAANDRDSTAKPRGQAPSRSGDDSVLQSLSFGRSRKPSVGGATGALMVASLLAAVGLSAGGYMVWQGKADGKMPKRVADALSVVQGQPTDATAPASGSAPLAAVALAPKPAAQAAAAPDLSRRPIRRPWPRSAPAKPAASPMCASLPTAATPRRSSTSPS